MRLFARHGYLAPLLIAGLSLLSSALLSCVAPLPQPQFHDEFSYLLAGDTFAHGRLTNPAHPLWQFFETFQVLQQPTYMSKYPPLQGLFLALGQVLTGEPIVGVWISTALACALAWWTLCAVVPRRWATLAAIGIVFHPLLLGWNWSYWGGAGGMIGGCLVIGSFLRLLRRPTFGTGATLGCGIGILLNSRPFEGAAILILCTLPLLLHGHVRVAFNRRIIAGCLSILLPIAAWTGYYNYRVTGHPLQFPYMLYEQQYAANPPLIWRPPGAEKIYRHPAMREYYLAWELPRYLQQRTMSGLLVALGEKLWSLTAAYFASPTLLIPLLATAAAFRRDVKLQFGAVIGVLFLLPAFSGLWFFSHYSSPAAVIYFFILLQGVRHIRAGWKHGRLIARGIIVLHYIAAGVWFFRQMNNDLTQWNYQRAAYVQAVRDKGEKELIIVRPGQERFFHADFVYNDADLDASPLIWARDMGEPANRALYEYFKDRKITLWEPMNATPGK